MFEGADIAFDFNFEKEIETTLPDDGIDSMVFRVLDLTGSIILKGQALQGRKNQKDAYDIFALTHYMGGPTQAAQYFNRTFADKDVSRGKRGFAQNSLAVIRRKFRNETSSGPFDVETFTEMKYRRNIVAARVNKFLEDLEDL